MPWVEAPTTAIVSIRESRNFVSHEPRRCAKNSAWFNLHVFLKSACKPAESVDTCGRLKPNTMRQKISIYANHIKSPNLQWYFPTPL
jgi:hypothetical protein